MTEAPRPDLPVPDLPVPDLPVPDPFGGRLVDPASVAAAIEHVAAAIAEARAAVRDGGDVDLIGLDAGIAAICNAIVAFQDDSGQGFLPTLLDLAEGLETLSADLTRQNAERLRAEADADQATRRHRAAEAYGRAAGPAAPAPDK